MRLLFIICEAGVDGRVMDILDHVGAAGYTRFSGATGKGKHGRRDGTPIWPGLNSIIMSYVDEAHVEAIFEGLDHLEEERNGRLAVKIFSVPAEEHC